MRIPRKSRLVTGIVAATTLVSGATFAVASGTASAHDTTHTLKLTAVSTASHGFSQTSFGGADTDHHKGKVIGYDVITGTFDTATNEAKIHVAVALKGGIMLITLTENSSSQIQGVITGGDGRFAGVQGTVTGHSPSQNSKKTFVTLRYHF